MESAGRNGFGRNQSQGPSDIAAGADTVAVIVVVAAVFGNLFLLFDCLGFEGCYRGLDLGFVLIRGDEGLEERGNALRRGKTFWVGFRETVETRIYI